jgi:hypothetical protein
MSSRLAARITGKELGVLPRNYGHLQGLAARYARARLDGRAVVSRATRQPILLDWRRGLSEATAPGTAPELLLSLPALPSLLANARYLGSSGQPRRCSGAQQTHGFGAMVDVIGRPIELCLVTREDGHGRLVFNGILSQAPLIAPREDGGVLPDGPGARSQALHAVLARAHLPPRRQDGGEADGADDEGEPPVSFDASSDASPEQIALGSTPMSGSGTEGMPPDVQPVLGGDECDAQFHEDEQICRALSDETSEERAIRSRCWQSAKTRRDLCKKGYDVPPLVTWRESTPVAPSRSMPSLPPLIFPVPPGQGAGGGFGLRPRQVIPFD